MFLRNYIIPILLNSPIFLNKKLKINYFFSILQINIRLLKVGSCSRLKSPILDSFLPYTTFRPLISYILQL